MLSIVEVAFVLDVSGTVWPRLEPKRHSSVSDPTGHNERDYDDSNKREHCVDPGRRGERGKVADRLEGEPRRKQGEACANVSLLALAEKD